MKHWTLDDIPWDRFDGSHVDAEVVKVVKAAAMVEANGGDYAKYLCNVFHDDAEFQVVAIEWALEEVQHGMALARWAKLADPSFDFDAAFKRFTDGFKIQTWRTESLRGSRSGELVSRCIVETGTSSYYSALKDAVDEPVLKEICRNIAADEFRHYKLFYDYLRRYLEVEKIGPLGRFFAAVSRIRESEDDELAYAYYAANYPADAAYEHKRFIRAYLRRAYGFYRPPHIERGIGMILKAIGLRPNGRFNAVLTQWLGWLLRLRVQHLARSEG
ncbi:MAG: ferritin-like domain-containing protein [Dongiaceae bacterium]